jgi:hypothetical protein
MQDKAKLARMGSRLRQYSIRQGKVRINVGLGKVRLS